MSESRRIAARFALVLPAFAVAALAVVLWLQLKDAEEEVAQKTASIASLSGELGETATRAKTLDGKLTECQGRAERLDADNRRMASYLAAERAMPRGSLGDFFLDYERFAQGLRFDVELSMAYRVRWKLDEDVPGHKGKTTRAAGEPTRLQGVSLGRRSNFAFGLVALPDGSDALKVPTSDAAFRPPEREVIEERDLLWDKKADYVPADPHFERILQVRITAIGEKLLEPPVSGRVVRAWREAGRGYTVLVIGTSAADDGVDPGPPFVPEQAWMGSTQELKVFPMTAPNGGIVLHKEHLAQAYGHDRAHLPKVNSAFDYYRSGWLRTRWDGIPGRIEVLFGPLPPGKQDSLSPQVHSLVFPMIERQAYWVPFWTVRERLMAPAELNLASVPAYNVESRRFPYLLTNLPTLAAGDWDPQAFQSALYDLLKNRPASP